MDINHHLQPHRLERYSFLWSEVRLVVAAVALLLGGIPPVLLILPGIAIVVALLKLAWIISGIAAGYLLYRWIMNGYRVFGGSDTKDVAALVVSIVSGLNLGIAGLLATNIGMTIASGRIIFLIAGFVYLAAAYHLFRRWKAMGEKLF